MAPPVLVKSPALFGTNQLPKFEEDLFRTTNFEVRVDACSGTLRSRSFEILVTRSRKVIFHCIGNVFDSFVIRVLREFVSAASEGTKVTVDESFPYGDLLASQPATMSPHENSHVAERKRGRAAGTSTTIVSFANSRTSQRPVASCPRRHRLASRHRHTTGESF